jgi:adenosylmethionine-8-amino-7-oxononanoate aminotransferase
VADVRILGAIGVVEMVDDIDVEKTQNQLIKNGVWLKVGPCINVPTVLEILSLVRVVPRLI